MFMQRRSRQKPLVNRPSLTTQRLLSSCLQHSRIQIIHFDQSDPDSIVYTANDRGVVTWWQHCNDRRLPPVSRSVAAVPDIAHLIAGDNSADYRGPPVIVRRNQSTVSIIQFQCRISHRIRNAVLSELWANGTHNHSLWLRPRNDESANYHVVTCLHKAASANVA